MQVEPGWFVSHDSQKKTGRPERKIWIRHFSSDQDIAVLQRSVASFSTDRSFLELIQLTQDTTKTVNPTQ
jgi:hypothetical protein